MTDALRYFSQIIIPGIGTEGQRKINASSVLIIGVGGLGCPVLSYLSAMGVGKLGIVDADIVEIKNLHRQVLYDESDIGRLKVEVAKEKILKQNSGIKITAYPERFTEGNAKQILKDYDIVIDCCDNTATRYLIDEITHSVNKPFVYGAVRQMEGQVSVFNYKDGPSYIDLFPDKELAAREQDCAAAGIIGYVTGIVGSLQVNEALKIILDDIDILTGEVLTLNMQTLSFRKFKIIS